MLGTTLEYRRTCDLHKCVVPWLLPEIKVSYSSFLHFVSGSNKTKENNIVRYFSSSITFCVHMFIL
jgi:hypothetical protein